MTQAVTSGGFLPDIELQRNTLTVSYEQNGFGFSIRNNTENDAFFNNLNHKRGDDFPDIDDIEQPSKLDYIYLHFSYGDEAGDITDLESSGLIAVTILSDDEHDFSADWGVCAAENERVGRYFKIYPKTTTALASGDALNISVQGIKCNSTTGSTPLNLTVKSNGIVNNVQANLIKYPQPVISQLEIPQKKVNVGDEITVIWKVLNYERCEIKLNGEQVSESSFITDIAKADSEYTLSVRADTGFYIEKTCEPALEMKIRYFEITEGDGDLLYIMVGWVTDNTKPEKAECRLKDIGAVPLSGSHRHTFPDNTSPGSVTFTLELIDKKTSTVLDSKTLTFNKPYIKTFTAKRLVDKLDNSTGFIPPGALSNSKFKDFFITIYSVTRPALPRTHTVILSWEAMNAEYCELNGTRYEELSRTAEMVTVRTSFRLKAIAKCGFFAAKRASI